MADSSIAKSTEKTGSFKDLRIWQRSLDLAEVIYALTAELPKSEEFGLKSQLRRCAVSIPSNIAEGSKRVSRKDFSHFLNIANGSAAELETQLMLGARIYPELAWASVLEEANQIQRMLTTFIRTVH